MMADQTGPVCMPMLTCSYVEFFRYMFLIEFKISVAKSVTLTE